jgi:hypothetical protein
MHFVLESFVNLPVIVRQQSSEANCNQMCMSSEQNRGTKLSSVKPVASHTPLSTPAPSGFQIIIFAGPQVNCFYLCTGALAPQC